MVRLIEACDRGGKALEIVPDAGKGENIEGGLVEPRLNCMGSVHLIIRAETDGLDLPSTVMSVAFLVSFSRTWQSSLALACSTGSIILTLAGEKGPCVLSVGVQGFRVTMETEATHDSVYS